MIQYPHYRWRAKLDTQRADLEKRSEYTTARWLDANMNGGRVYVTGSTAFWLNAFSRHAPVERLLRSGAIHGGAQ